MPDLKDFMDRGVQVTISDAVPGPRLTISGPSGVVTLFKSGVQALRDQCDLALLAMTDPVDPAAKRTDYEKVVEAGRGV